MSRDAGGERVALVTGASSGFGRGVADALHGLGWTVVGTLRRRPGPDDAETPWTAMTMDVTNEASVRAVLASVEQRWGRLDVVVNNAGIAVLGPVEELDAGDWRRQLEVNLVGPMTVCRLALPLLRESRGLVVQLSSINGRVSEAMVGAYAASKFGLEAASDALAAEVADDGVRVLVVEPSAFRTRIAENAILAGSRDPAGRYGEMWTGLLDGLAGWSETAADPDQCVAAVVAALTRADVPPRLPVGPEAGEIIRRAMRTVLDGLDAGERFVSEA